MLGFFVSCLFEVQNKSSVSLHLNWEQVMLSLFLFPLSLPPSPTLSEAPMSSSAVIEAQRRRKRSFSVRANRHRVQTVLLLLKWGTLKREAGQNLLCFYWLMSSLCYPKRGENRHHMKDKDWQRAVKEGTSQKKGKCEEWRVVRMKKMV